MLGNAAATPTPSSSPKAWVSIFKVIAGAGILAYVAWAFRRPVDPDKRATNIARIRRLDKASALTIVALIVMTALALSLLRDGISALTG